MLVLIRIFGMSKRFLTFNFRRTYHVVLLAKYFIRFSKRLLSYTRTRVRNITLVKS